MNTSLKDLAFADVVRELDNTRVALLRIPTDRLGYKPHERSYSIGDLGTHIANLPVWLKSTLADDGFDFAKAPPRLAALPSTEAIVETFDKNVGAFVQVFESVDDEALRQPWTLRHGDHVISSDPRHWVLRLWGISHIVHHRAQLSVYLRMLDVPVPSLYGPTADEQPG